MDKLKSKFSIEVISEKPEEIWGLCHTGEITMGDYLETFSMSLDSWDVEDYKQQWKEGLKRIKTHDRSCLVSFVQSVDTKPMVEMWVLYKVENTVYVQQHLLNKQILKDLNSPLNLTNFTKENCYQFIDDRKVNAQGCGISDSGDYEVSEWKVSLNAFDQY